MFKICHMIAEKGFYFRTVAQHTLRHPQYPWLHNIELEMRYSQAKLNRGQVSQNRPALQQLRLKTLNYAIIIVLKMGVLKWILLTLFLKQVFKKGNLDYSNKPCQICRRRLGKSIKGAGCTTLIFPAWGGFKSIACFALRQILLLINLIKSIQIFYRLKISQLYEHFNCITARPNIML